MSNLIYKKLNDIMKDVEFVPKDKKNSQQGYNFRGIDSMYNALHPLFAKHGVFITSEVVGSTREDRQTKSGGTLLYSIVDVKFSFYAEDGSSVSSTMKGEAMDSADKATNKAVSAALKYTVMQMFLIPTEDMPDADKETPEVKPKTEVKKVEPPKEKLTDTQLAMIDNLVHNSILPEEEKLIIEKRMYDFSRERAEKCIEHLKANQKKDLDGQLEDTLRRAI